MTLSPAQPMAIDADDVAKSIRKERQNTNSKDIVHHHEL